MIGFGNITEMVGRPNPSRWKLDEFEYYGRSCANGAEGSGAAPSGPACRGREVIQEGAHRRSESVRSAAFPRIDRGSAGEFRRGESAHAPFAAGQYSNGRCIRES